MFPCRGLFLAVTLSLTSIVLADVLVQPGYDHLGRNPHYSQSTLHQTEQYHTKQLPNQELRYLQSARTVYPYYESKDSNLVGYTPYHHYSPYHSWRNHPHYARIGTHEYSRPSVFVGYRQPSGPYHWNSHHHYRYRRSLDSDSTNTESSESANVAHDDDVASKSSLTDDKHPKATDSLLPEHEPTDTNDKHVENRQIKNEHIMAPRLFGIYPQNIRFPEHSQNIRFPTESKDTMQQAIQFPSTSTLNFSPEEESSQRSKQACTSDESSYLLANRPSTRIRFEPFLEEPTNDNYNSKYRDASPSDFLANLLSNNMRYYWSGLYNIYVPSSYYSPYSSYYTPSYITRRITSRTADQGLEKKSLQEITNMDMINTAEPKQDEMKLYIPYYPQNFARTTNPPIKENEEKPWTPNIDEISRYLEQDVPESDIPDNSEFKRNFNSDSTKPSIWIPNYSYVSDYIPNYDLKYNNDIITH